MAINDAQPSEVGEPVAAAPTETSKRKVVDFREKGVPPINHCLAIHDHLLDIYSELVGIKESWNKAVAGFRAIQHFDKDLLEVAVWSMPESVNTEQLDEQSKLCDTALTDEGYAAELDGACKARTALARLNLLWQLAARYQLGKEDAKRKVDKLKERVKLQKANSPEWIVAVRKKNEMQSAVDVIQHRLDALAEKYFDTRLKMLKQLVKLDERFFELYKHDTGLANLSVGYECGFVEAMLASGARPMANEMIRAEEAVRVANFNKKVSNKAKKGF